MCLSCLSKNRPTTIISNPNFIKTLQTIYFKLFQHGLCFFMSPPFQSSLMSSNIMMRYFHSHHACWVWKMVLLTILNDFNDDGLNTRAKMDQHIIIAPSNAIETGIQTSLSASCYLWDTIWWDPSRLCPTFFQLTQSHRSWIVMQVTWVQH